MTGIVILAAGSSSRMGQPKQKLIYQQKTLLQRSIDVALGIPEAVVLVVLGANAEAIKTDIQGLPVQIVYSANWETGMSSSIITGITTLLAYNEVDKALLMLCDQPFVDTALLEQLIGLKPQTDDYVVACQYGNTVGVPALFSKSYFNELLALTGQEGAKKLLIKHQDEIITVPFEQGSIDIDTPEDYNSLNQGQF